MCSTVSPWKMIWPNTVHACVWSMRNQWCSHSCVIPAYKQMNNRSTGHTSVSFSSCTWISVQSFTGPSAPPSHVSVLWNTTLTPLGVTLIMNNYVSCKLNSTNSRITPTQCLLGSTQASGNSRLHVCAEHHVSQNRRCVSVSSFESDTHYSIKIVENKQLHWISL